MTTHVSPLLRAATLAVAAATLATGCSTIRNNTGLLPDREAEYRNAEELPPLEIPEGMDDSRIEPLLPIPPVATQEVSDDFEVPRPSSLLARDPGDPVKIQKLADRRWLLITDTPQSVWPRLKQFLLDNGVPVAQELPRDGLMRTDWLQVGSGHRDAVRSVLESTAGAGQHRLHFRVEQGVREGTTEIHVRQQQGFVMAEVAFPEASANSEAEAQVLTEVGSYLAAIATEPGAESAVSMLAQDISAETKASMERADGQPALRLNLDFARAWATVGQALANAEVEVTDLNREDAVFYVALTDAVLERDGAGFFARVIPFLGDDDAIPLQIRLQAAPGAPEGFHVVVRDEAAAAVDAELGERVLTLIREYAG